MQKATENLKKSEKTLVTTSHLFYKVYPLIKEKKLLINILQETKKSVAICINTIMHHEYFFNRIKVSKDPEENLKIFIEKCCPNYEIEYGETKKILELFEISKKHEESPFEFKRKEEVVILSKESEVEILSEEKIKQFLELARKILNKSKIKFSKK